MHLVFDDRKKIEPKEDFLTSLAYAVKVFRTISGIKTEHTDPVIMESPVQSETAFIWITCDIYPVKDEDSDIFITDTGSRPAEDIFVKYTEKTTDDENREIYRVKYRILCPSGYWGNNRRAFIDEIKKRL